MISYTINHIIQSFDTLEKLNNKICKIMLRILGNTEILFVYKYIVNETDRLVNIENIVLFSVSCNNYLYNGFDYALVFNPAYYAEKYSDLKAVFGTDSLKLFEHFIMFGMKEGRQAIESFNVHAYKNRYVDLQQVFGNDLQKYYQHYIQFGHGEKRVTV